MSDLKTYSFSELLEIIPVSRSTLWRWVRDGTFPSPISIGPNSCSWVDCPYCARVWRVEDIRTWFNEKANNAQSNQELRDRLPRHEYYDIMTPEQLSKLL